MKLKYYQDGKGNVYELKTELEQIMINDIIELTDKKNKLQSIINEITKYINKNKENTFQTLDFENNKSYNSALIELLDKLKELKENKHV